MPGKRVQLGDETWEAIEAVMRDNGDSFNNSPMKPLRIC
jgi:hypothetical protein